MYTFLKSGEEQAVLMNDASGDQHHRLPHGTDWRRSRSESSVPADDMETSYVPTTAYLPGPHRRHHVRKIKIKYKEILFYKLLFLLLLLRFSRRSAPLRMCLYRLTVSGKEVGRYAESRWFFYGLAKRGETEGSYTNIPRPRVTVWLMRTPHSFHSRRGYWVSGAS